MVTEVLFAGSLINKGKIVVERTEPWGLPSSTPERVLLERKSERRSQKEVEMP